MFCPVLFNKIKAFLQLICILIVEIGEIPLVIFLFYISFRCLRFYDSVLLHWRRIFTLFWL